MQSISEQIFAKILLMPSASIKKVLQEHFNPEAQYPTELFSKTIQYDRVLPPSQTLLSCFHKPPHHHILNSVWQFAPQDVCLQIVKCLESDAEEHQYARLHQDAIDPKTPRIEEYILYHMLHYAPEAAQQRLAGLILNWGEKNIKRMMDDFHTQDPHFKFTFFIQRLLHIKNPDTCLILLQTLFKLDNSYLADFFLETDNDRNTLLHFILDILALQASQSYTEAHKNILLSIFKRLYKADNKIIISFLEGDSNDDNQTLHVLLPLLPVHLLEPLFQILYKLPQKTFYTLLKERGALIPRDSSMRITQEHSVTVACTPLELIFNQKIPHALSIPIVDYLSRQTYGLDLLHNASWSFRSSPPYYHAPLHLAAKYHHITALLTYLENNPDTHLNHKNKMPSWKKNQTVIEVAKENQCPAIVNIALLLPFYRYIQAPEKCPSFSFEAFETSMQHAEKDIFKTRWLDDKTLLHHAAEQGNVKAVHFLLNHDRAHLEKDQDGNTPFDIAIAHKHWECVLAFIKTPLIDIQKPLKNGEYPLVLFYKIQHYTLITTSLLRLQESQSVCIPMWRTLPGDIEKIPAPMSMSLAPVLQEDLHLEDFCNTHKHFTTPILATAFRLMLPASANILVFQDDIETQSQYLVTWLLQRLERIQETKDTRQKAYLRDQAIIALFSISDKKLETLIPYLLQDSKALLAYREPLHWLIAQGCVSPWVLSRISKSIMTRLYDLLSTESQKTVATVHIQKTELTKLAMPLLPRLIQNISFEDLLLYCQQRHDGILHALVLERSIEKNGFEHDSSKTLMDHVISELERHDESDNNLSRTHLRYILNSICSKDPLDAVNEWIARIPERSPIIENIEKLYCETLHPDDILKDSVFYGLIKHYAKYPHIRTDEAFHQAFLKHLTFFTPSDIDDILSHYQTQYTPRTALHIRLAKHEDKKILQRQTWFIHLAERLPYARYATLIDLTHHLLQEMTLLETKGLKNIVVLRDPLLKFQQHLYHCHLEKSSVQQETAFDFSSWDIVIQKLQKEIPLKNKAAHAILLFLHEQLPKLYKETQELVTQAQETLRAWFHSITTHIIPHPQSEETYQYTREALQHDTYTPEYIQKSTQILIQGLQKHPQKGKLLVPILQHLYASHQLILLPLDTITPILSVLHEQEWEDLYQFFNQKTEQHLQIIEYKKILEPWTSNIPSGSEKAFLRMLSECSVHTLEVLADAARLATAYELETLLHTAKMCKQHHIPLHDWLQETPFYDDDNHLMIWLRESLEKIDAFSCQFLSLSTTLLALHKPNISHKARLATLEKTIDTQLLALHPGAVAHLINLYRNDLEQDAIGDIAQAFAYTFACILYHAPVQTHAQMIEALPGATHEALLNHLLSGITSELLSRRTACRHLIKILITHSSTHNLSWLASIQKRLNEQDMYLLGTEKLTLLAHHILKQKQCSTEEATYQGVWLQRLLTSPAFIAECSPDNMEQLITRYRLLSMALKQDEFDTLNRFLEKKLAFGQKDKTALAKAYQDILHNPTQKKSLIEKRDRLLTFRTDDAVRALLNQLEIHCLEQINQKNSVAETALQHLYQYLNQELSSFNTHLFFRLSDFFHKKVLGDCGDIQKINNTIYRWMDTHLPHTNFIQRELMQKQSHKIYDRKKIQIGIIDENGFAIGIGKYTGQKLINCRPELENEPLYNEARQIIGRYNHQGIVEHENIFQKDTSARLLAKLSEDELLNAPAGLDLLIQDVLRADTIKNLYESPEVQKNPHKRTWLAQQINCRFANTQESLAPETIAHLIHAQNKNEIAHLLQYIRHPENAFQCILALCRDPEKQIWLFDNPAWLSQILIRFNAFDFLKKYLISAYQEPWFADGLRLFAAFAQEKNKSRLLLNALIAIGKMQGRNHIHEQTPQHIMEALMSNAQAADIVLRLFLRESHETAITQRTNQDIADFTSLCTKNNIVAALKNLNKTRDWNNNAQYRLILHALHHHHERIFIPQEYRYARQIAWIDTDLLEATLFLKRHLRMTAISDPEHTITEKLIAEITLRTANFGQLALFYELKNNVLQNPLIIDRNTLHYRFKQQTVITDTTERFFNGMLASLWTQVQNLVLGTQQSTISRQELAQHQAIIDWKKLEKNAWQLKKDKHLPLIHAYLFHYTGKTESLRALLKDLINTYMINQQESASLITLFEDWSLIVSTFPQRDVSALLFESLSTALSQHPEFLNHTILHALARYHWQQHLHNKPEEQTSKTMLLALMTHYGQQKQYALISKICELMTTAETHQAPKKTAHHTLTHIAREAKAEKILLRHINTWYFTILQFIVRLWYGTRHTPSHIVKYADNQQAYVHPARTPDTIRTDVESGQIISKNLRLVDNLPRLKAMRHQLETMGDNKKISNSPYGFLSPKPLDHAISIEENEEGSVEKTF